MHWTKGEGEGPLDYDNQRRNDIIELTTLMTPHSDTV